MSVVQFARRIWEFTTLTDYSDSRTNRATIMNTNQEGNGLGSLTQAVRSKQLNSARTVLLVVGVLSLLVNVGFVFMAETLVDKQYESELSKLREQGMDIDQDKVAELRAQDIRALRLLNGAGAVLGLVFIFLGLNVKKYPVPMTITGLVLYLGSAAVFGYLDPSTLARGWIIKGVIVVSLFKAIQAAIAYEKEDNRETFAPLADAVE